MTQSTNRAGAHTIKAIALLSCAVFGSQAAFAQTIAPAPTPVDTVPGPLPSPQPEPAPSAAVTPLYGNINPFYGNINPFWGNINPFYGNINPFYGNINPFWGNINPFDGNIQPFWGTINPFVTKTGVVAPAWGSIQPFWEDVGAKFGTADATWQAAQGTTALNPAYATIAATLRDVIAQSSATWGAAVTAKTGKTFDAGFVAPLLARFGIDLNDPATLAALSKEKRAEFYLAYYDGLMAYSGQDRFDHWMRTANWSPAVTQQQGSGTDTIIGVLDAGMGVEADLIGRVFWTTGNSGFANGHGAAVASLLVSAHDGQGVMGIAPRARVALNNPFDATGTANWTDVRNGIVALKASNASIINASLGESGATLPSSWNGVFGDPTIAARKSDSVYVIAAGNEGFTQTRNIEWTASAGTNFLLVGSVDPAEQISGFSNRPGDACLIVNGICGSSPNLADGGRLMNHFIVAPGELILVSDGQGGTVRRTGTSFAAPLVSGAIALLHDRWPWLAKDPQATVDIIVRSAKDLGAPGVDPVYGVGLLDITGSQSPLDYNKLWYYKVENGVITSETPATLRATGSQTTWEANNVFFVLFENVGKSRRDFAVPMSSVLSKYRISINGGAFEQFQSFLTDSLTDFINGADGGNFTDVRHYATPDRGGWRMGIASEDPSAYLARRTDQVPHSAFHAYSPDGGLSFAAGHGLGAMELGGQAGFGMTSDFAETSGVNPILGLASGGSFLNTALRIAPNTLVAFGYTERDLAAKDNLALSESERRFNVGNALKAHALNVRVTHDFAPGTSLSINYTRLKERDALLAVQASNGLLDEGSLSESMTLAGDTDLGHGLTIAASGSLGRSAIADRGQQLVTNGAGLLTSAYAISATKNGVVTGNDRLRLTFSQPLHVEGGSMTLHTTQVTDRETGAVGVVDTRFDGAGNSRVHTAELLYAAPVAAGHGELSLFGRATFGEASDTRSGYVGGVRLRLQM